MNGRWFAVAAGTVALVGIVAPPATAGRSAATSGPPQWGVAARPGWPSPPALRFTAPPGLAAGRPMLPAPVQATPATTESYLYLDSSVAAVTTNQKVPLRLGLYASNETSGGKGSPTDLDVDLWRNTIAGYEEHDWDFEVPFAFLSYHKASGRGILTTGTRHIAPYGRISLRFTKTAVHHISCSSSGSELAYRGILAGTVQFNTRGRWGSVDRTFTFPGRTTIDLTSGCYSSHETACYRAIGWSDLYQNTPRVYSELYGTTERHSYVYAYREVVLAQPKHAERFDFLREPAPAESLVTSGSTPPVTGKLTAPVPKGREISGSPRVVETGTWDGVYELIGSCKNGATSEQEYEAEYGPAGYHVPPNGLTAHFAVGSNITVKANKRGEIEQYSFH